MKRISLLIAAALLAVVLAIGTALPGFAKITEERTNPAGNETQGQGKAITVTNVNPAGHAPPGQN